MAAARDAHAISERPACAILGVDPTSVGYVSRRSDDAPLRALAAERRRFSYRRLGCCSGAKG